MADTASALSGQAPPGPPAPLGGAIIDRAAADEIERRHRDPSRPRPGQEGHAAVAAQDAELFKKAYGTAETGTTAAAESPSVEEVAEASARSLGGFLRAPSRTTESPTPRRTSTGTSASRRRLGRRRAPGPCPRRCTGS